MKPLFCLILTMMFLCTLCACVLNKTDSSPLNTTESTHAHSWNEWETAKQATCREEGSRVGVCECGEQITMTVGKEEHVPGAWLLRPADGSSDHYEKYRQCTVCREKLDTSSVQLSGTYGLYYSVSDDGTTCSVQKYAGSDSAVVIPESIGGYPVTGLETMPSRIVRMLKVSPLRIPSPISVTEHLNGVQIL